MAKKVLFSNISRKLNPFDKRPTRVIESTDRSLVHVLISGAMFHVRLLTFILTEAVCCFPTERQSLLMDQKIERRQRGKPIQRKTHIH